MGIVLPHGGLTGLYQLGRHDIEWGPEKLYLRDEVERLPVEFAAVGNTLGQFASGSLVLPLIFTFGERHHEWVMPNDGVRPHGVPRYFTTEQTANALWRGDVHGDNTIEIDRIRYRLHAAYLDVWHVAVLMRAKW